MTFSEELENEFKEMAFVLENVDSACWVYAVYAQAVAREEIISRLKKEIELPFFLWDYSEEKPYPIDYLRDLTEEQKQQRAIVSFFNTVDGGDKTIKSLDFNREKFAEQPHSLIFWVTENELGELARGAGHFWAQRRATFNFSKLVLEQAEQNIYYSTGEWLNNLINIDNYKEALQQLNFYQQLLIKYPPVHLLKHHAQPFHALVFNELRLISETNDKISYLLYYLGRYLDAITFCENSLNIYQFLLGENEYPTVASSNNLALLYAHTERYIEAEYLFKKTLAILEQQFNYLPNVATLLNNLGWLYYVQARYEEAEPLFLKSLAIKENTLEKNHPDIARTLNLLAAVYYYQRKYGEANSLYLKSLAIWEATVGKNHPDVARVLNSVALLNTVQGKYERAETLYMRSLEILEEILGIEHPTTKKAKLTYEQFLAEKAAREKSNQP